MFKHFDIEKLVFFKEETWKFVEVLTNKKKLLDTCYFLRNLDQFVANMLFTFGKLAQGYASGLM